MNRKIAVMLVTLSIVAGMGAGFLIHLIGSDQAEAKSPDPMITSTTPTPEQNDAEPEGTTNPSTDESSESDDSSNSPMDLFLSPGKVSAGEGGATVKIGTPVQSAIDTGLVELDEDRAELCGGGPLSYRWSTPEAREAMDILVTPDGTIASIGAMGRTYRTWAGTGVGTTYGELKSTHGPDLSDATAAGYDQSGVFIRQGDDWLGFLFDARVSDLTSESKVTFVEVTRDRRPSLMRDGC